MAVSKQQHTRERISFTEVAGDGVYAGLIGASAVALWFLVVDTWVREPFFTPSLVANVVLHGQDANTAAPISLPLVAAYSAFHALAFVAYGILASWVIDQFQETPEFPVIAMGLFVTLEGGFVAAMKLFYPEVPAIIGHGFIVVGNVLGAVSMAVWYSGWQRHPSDLRELEKARASH